MRTDADERQEYATLRLEGFSENEARQMARSANDAVNRRRLAGPRTADKGGHGLVPMISDMQGEQWHATVPVTLDTRTDEEREEDWAMQDRLRALLDYCTDLQRAVLSDLYGLDTGRPMSYAECGQKYGYGPEWASKRRTQALATIRRNVENPPLTATEKADRKREQKRLQKQRQRARQRVTRVTNIPVVVAS